jgi:preprotein translocase SecE subunit
MSFGIYKPGQGYWVRTMSAVFAGILFLVGAAWGWDQAQKAPIPARAYDFSVGLESGQVQVGSIVTLERMDSTGAFVPFGSALAESFSATTGNNGKLVITSIDIQAEGSSYANVERITGDQTTSAFIATVKGRTPIPYIPKLYLQAGVAGLVILIGAIVVFWFAGSSKRTVDFLVATDGEMKKVNWSTKKEIIGSTQVVIVAAVLISLILFLIDVGFSNFFRFIHVLES